MRTLTLDLGERSYPILVGHGLLEQQGLLDPHIRGRDVLIVTNQTVGPLYEEQVRALLGRVRVTTVALPDGEAHKTMATVGSVLDALVAGRYGRDAVVLALGGGVVGDIAGFAAAIYQRGIDFVQVPTTLLAQVDSAVGGKTGVNHPGGKNLIGAFHQPVAVVADTATLTTLPDRELSAGLAEVVKYGLIVDADFYAWLESAADALLARDPAALEEAICRCCALKAEVVGQDEREQGRRALLNLGHTFGHAIEVRTGYGTWLHGEAVAAGMVMAAAFSARLGRLPQTEVERLRRLLRRLRLPVAPPPDDAEAFHAAMALDKKVIARRIRLVLLDGIGSASVTGDYPQDELAGFLAGQLAA